MVRTRGLCFLLIGSALLWGALCVWSPCSRQTEIFFGRGAELFSDFSMPRTCAQAEDPYAAEAVSPYDRCYAMLGYALAGVFPADYLTGGLMFTMMGATLFVLTLGILIDTSRRGEWWMIAALTLTAPFIENLERANQIWIAAAGVALFLAWHESESRWKRIAALLALAVASALKIAPGVFSLLLLKERRWRDFLFFAAAGAVLTIVPFVIWGDLGMVGEWLARMGDHNEIYRLSKKWAVARLAWTPLFVLGLPRSALPSVYGIGQLADFAIGGMAVYCFFKTSERRDEALLLAVCAMILPSNSRYYTLLYLLPAFALLGKDRLPIGEAVLWLVLLTPLQPNFGIYSPHLFVSNVVFFSLVAYRCVQILRKR